MEEFYNFVLGDNSKIEFEDLYENLGNEPLYLDNSTDK